ncbi:MAG: hypothetical protein LAT61_13265 [Alcanivorax sp.]|nr:hypothetical protein [Alcanivorax sp.]
MAELTKQATRKAGRRHAWLDSLLWLLPVMALALGLNIAGREATLPWLVTLWLLISLVMWAGLWRRGLSRRRAFLTAYLHPGSRWRWRLRGGALLALRLWLQSALLALVLLVALVRQQQDLLWWLLGASLLVLVALHSLLQRGLRPHIAPVYLPELSWRLTLALQFILLFTALAGLALFVDYPDFTDASLRQALWHEMARERAASPWLEALLQAAAAKDALVWWLSQQLLPGVGSPLLRAGAWLLLLAAEGLFVWSWLVLAAGAASLSGQPLPASPRPDQVE